MEDLGDNMPCVSIRFSHAQLLTALTHGGDSDVSIGSAKLGHGARRGSFWKISL